MEAGRRSLVDESNREIENPARRGQGMAAAKQVLLPRAATLFSLNFGVVVERTRADVKGRYGRLLSRAVAPVPWREHRPAENFRAFRAVSRIPIPGAQVKADNRLVTCV
jgi:hypothetical protein